MTRQGRFAALMKRYQQSPDDYDEGEEEDPRPYFTGECELSRYVCVTVNFSSHGESKYFFLPTFDSVEDAADRAVLFAEDDIFEELPVEVHDLDSGCSFLPKWDTLQFEPEPGPCAGSQC